MLQQFYNPANTQLGTFDTQEEAAKVYDKATRMYLGAKAELNFPKSNEDNLENDLVATVAVVVTPIEVRYRGVKERPRAKYEDDIINLSRSVATTTTSTIAALTSTLGTLPSRVAKLATLKKLTSSSTTSTTSSAIITAASTVSTSIATVYIIASTDTTSATTVATILATSATRSSRDRCSIRPSNNNNLGTTIIPGVNLVLDSLTIS
uniref:Cold shock domain protein 2 n=1 Tax=Solanum tuberosum TaxID=4113 RepID=M1DYS5_SOLTU